MKFTDNLHPGTDEKPYNEKSSHLTAIDRDVCKGVQYIEEFSHDL